MRSLILTTTVACFFAGSSAGQELNPPQTLPPDVVVEAQRPLTKEEREFAPKGFSAPGYDPEDTITFYDGALGAARCATVGPLADLVALRAVVDGAFNSSAHDRQMSLLIRKTATCGMGPQTKAYLSEPFPASEREIGIVHRGAFMLRALKTFAPDLALTREQLSDPVVQQRFHDRESSRNRHRVPMDMAYLKVAICFVQQDPNAAQQILRTTGRSELYRISVRMIDRHRSCVGGARRVYMDWLQFRLYIADATYRWGLAVRNVPSLIPSVDVAGKDIQPIK